MLSPCRVGLIYSTGGINADIAVGKVVAVFRAAHYRACGIAEVCERMRGHGPTIDGGQRHGVPRSLVDTCIGMTRRPQFV